MTHGCDAMPPRPTGCDRVRVNDDRLAERLPERLPDLARRCFAYLGAGLVATVPMTVVMLLAQATGRMGTQPPRRMVDEATDHDPAGRPPGPARTAAAAVLHFALGGVMAIGLAPFLAAVRRIPRSIGAARGVIAGAAFGASLYALNYVGLAPALGILPPPTRDRPGRQPTMVAAHLVYGVAAALLVRTLGPAASREAKVSGTSGDRARS